VVAAWPVLVHWRRPRQDAGLNSLGRAQLVLALCLSVALRQEMVALRQAAGAEYVWSPEAAGLRQVVFVRGPERRLLPELYLA
jgi:hypothetical protein